MTDIRDVKRKVPMSLDMLHSRTVAVFTLVAVAFAVWILIEGWEWLMREVIW